MNRRLVTLAVTIAPLAATLAGCNAPQCGAGTKQVQQSDGTLKCLPAAPCVVPPKDVFVMGDNRTESYDSRYFGPIPESTVVGRAFFRIWPLNRLGSL